MGWRKINGRKKVHIIDSSYDFDQSLFNNSWRGYKQRAKYVVSVDYFMFYWMMIFKLCFFRSVRLWTQISGCEKFSI